MVYSKGLGGEYNHEPQERQKHDLKEYNSYKVE